LTALCFRIDGNHSAGGAFEDRVGVFERSDPGMLAGFIDEVARGPNLRTHRSVGKRNARKFARRRMPEGPGHVSAPIQKERIDIGQHHQPVSTELPRQKCAGAVLVNHRLDAGKAAVFQLDHGNAAATGANHNHLLRDQ